jgi:hypothetical protein
MAKVLAAAPDEPQAAATASDRREPAVIGPSVTAMGRAGRIGARRRMQLTDRDVVLLRWIGEQYCARGDLLVVLMARHSTDETVRAAGRVTDTAANRRIAAWRAEGLVATERFRANTPATVWLTTDGMAAAGLGWRATVPTFATVAHRHAVGVVRAWMEGRGLGDRWICERELRDGLDLDYAAPGRRDHLPNGVVVSTCTDGRVDRSAIEVELTRKTEARVVAILRHLLATYDDVVYRAAPGAATVVQRAAAGLSGGGAARVHVRPYPPPTLAEVA